MSDTPIHDQLAAELSPPVDDVVDDPSAADPGDCEPYADEDPDPVLHDDAGDDLADVPEGDDDDDDLDDDDPAAGDA